MSKNLQTCPKEDRVIAQLLAGTPFPRDALPYTDEFQRLKEQFAQKTKHAISDADFWQTLVRIGKRGGLARKGRHRKVPRAPALTTEQQLEIIRLMPEGIGRRDCLPYTVEFDRLHRQFSKLTRTRLTKHDFWRGLSRVAKRSRKPEPIFDAAPRGRLPRKAVEILETVNPWWRAEPAEPPERYRRWAFHETWQRLQGELTPAVAIRGPRQVGKTMIQHQLVEHLLLIKGVRPAHILRVQFDEVPGLGTLRQPILSIVRWFEKHVLRESINACASRGEPVYLLFDELQNLKTWAPELKLLVDHTSARTLITGSSSLRILRGQDSLAGRLSVIELGPLRLSEVAGVRKLGELSPIRDARVLENWTARRFWLDLCSTRRRRTSVLNKAFEHFSEVGGYPICHKSPRADRSELARNIAFTVVNRTIEHDEAVDPSGRVWDKDVLRETFRLVCRYAGMPVKPDRICGEVNQVLRSRVTNKEVAHAIQFLVDAMLVHRVEPLEAVRKKPRNGAKLCLCDHFVRQAWLQETVPISPKQLAGATHAVSTLAGHIIESVIGYYLKGIPGLEVAWLPARMNKTREIVEPEVDYVLTIGLRRIPVEIKYTRGKPTKPDLAGLESFCSKEKYNAQFGLVITQKIAGPLSDNVIAVPAAAFLSML